MTVGTGAPEAVELTADGLTLEGTAKGVVVAAMELDRGATASWMLKEYLLPVVGETAVTATVTVVPATEAGGSAVIVVPETVTQLVFVLDKISPRSSKSEMRSMVFKVPEMTGKIVPIGAELDVADALLGASVEDGVASADGLFAEELARGTTSKTKVRR